MSRPVSGSRATDRASEFVDEHVHDLRRAFPDLFFDWYPQPDALFIEIQSRQGTGSRTRVGYPLDVERVYVAARHHLENDASLDAVADRLVTATRCGYDKVAGQMPYVLQWLVMSQNADVTFGDHPDVSPVFRSPSIALVHTPTRRLKVWADGAAVLHYDELLRERSDELESKGLDLTRVALRDFQVMWLASHSVSAVANLTDLLDSHPTSSCEAAALRLLCDYDGGAWLQHGRFAETAMKPCEDGPVDWAAVNRLSVIHTEATLQDRAVLAIACHLSDHVTPLVTLPDALHYLGSARAMALDALAGLAGLHPDPDAAWPADCPTCT